MRKYLIALVVMCGLGAAGFARGNDGAYLATSPDGKASLLLSTSACKSPEMGKALLSLADVPGAEPKHGVLTMPRGESAVCWVPHAEPEPHVDVVTDRGEFFAIPASDFKAATRTSN